MATLFVAADRSAAGPGRPNVIFILADDLGYGDLGCYGQTRIHTPVIDRLGAQGIRFTNAYAGCTVCAPSRCTLLTGLHTGHCWVRGNRITTLDGQPTIASMLKSAGYTTGVIGKWGMSMPDEPGPPGRQGFDYFFGYMTHVDAHNYYPEFLWENDQQVRLPGNVVVKGVATERTTYAPDVVTSKALNFLEANRAHPFFLYLAFILPHANNEAGKVDGRGMEVPSDAPYSREDWPQAQKNHAAMITRLDSDVGKVLAKLDELGIADNTLVFFSSDNGPHKEGGADPEFFDSAGPLSGYKRSMTEGGIRVPMLVRWPTTIKPGQTSDLPWAFWDVMPTLADVCGAQAPEKIDGISIAPTLVGPERADGPQRKHEYLYWEFHERGFHQAIRFGPWKAIRDGLDGRIALYDLSSDLAEEHDLSAEQTEIVAEAKKLLGSARTDSELFPVTETK
ncbi:MAG TPA: arylsulfatase [Pirellulales bacterium]|nr:arylsulfatase [Pirellulales bacterium]